MKNNLSRFVTAASFSLVASLAFSSSLVFATTVGTDVTTNNLTVNGALTLASPLDVAQGGTGTNTAFTQGSLVFAGPSGVYSENNSGLFWDDTNQYFGIGTSTPGAYVDIQTPPVTDAPAFNLNLADYGYNCCGIPAFNLSNGSDGDVFSIYERGRVTINDYAGGFQPGLAINSMNGGDAIKTTGGAVYFNDSSNYDTNINTGSSNGSVYLGGGSADVVVDSNTWDISSGGLISGASGNISQWTNDSNYITAASVPANETDPIYSANTFATGMNQGVTTADSPTFVNVTASLTGNADTATTATSATTAGTVTAAAQPAITSAGGLTATINTVKSDGTTPCSIDVAGGIITSSSC